MLRVIVVFGRFVVSLGFHRPRRRGNVERAGITRRIDHEDHEACFVIFEIFVIFVIGRFVGSLPDPTNREEAETGAGTMSSSAVRSPPPRGSRQGAAPRPAGDQLPAGGALSPLAGTAVLPVAAS